MTIYFVTRHQGAKDWAVMQGIKVDQLIEHLDMSTIQQGDQVLGSLPVNLVAELNALGARYFHLSLVVPAELRGKEISAALMQELGASLEEFYITKIGEKNA